MNEICVLVDVCPGPVFILQIFDMELEVWRRPVRLDGGNVRPDDPRAGIAVGHCVLYENSAAP